MNYSYFKIVNNCSATPSLFLCSEAQYTPVFVPKTEPRLRMPRFLTKLIQFLEQQRNARYPNVFLLQGPSFTDPPSNSNALRFGLHERTETNKWVTGY